jgi:glycosyltransferase involved in cell wall biosynthesis
MTYYRNLQRYLRGDAPLMDRFAGCHADLSRILDGKRYDLAILEHFWTAPYLDLVARHADRLVLDLHNIESVWLERVSGTAAALERPAFQRWAETCRRLESELLPRFSLVLVPSEIDARTIRSLAPGAAVAVYPNAIPTADQPREKKIGAIVFSGNLEYEPNRTAVRYFAREIWPVILSRRSDIEWHLLGKNDRAIRAFVQSSPQVRVVGVVDDAVRELARYRVAVAPILSGSGTRLKIIEAWAAGTPVVSTTLGAEGLDAAPGEHLLLADDPMSFADAVERIFSDPELAQQLASEGRSLYLDRFSWDVIYRIFAGYGI